MALDSSSMCPGGTGKKIRDCGCNNLSDLQSIQKMLQGQQYAACLNYIDSLLAKNPDRACLLAGKCDVLFAKQIKDSQDGKADFSPAWEAALEEFYKYHPENPLALAWKSVKAAMEEDAEASYDFLEGAFMRHYPEMNPSGLLAALSVLFHKEMTSSNIPAALFLLGLRMTFLSQLNSPEELEHGRYVQVRLLSDPGIPLPLRQAYAFYQTNSRGAITAEFTAASQLVQKFHWLEAAQAFEKLAQADPTELNAAYNSAVLYMNRGKQAEAAKMFMLYAQREPDINRQVDALTTALLLKNNPLEDELPLYDIQYNVSDADKAKEILLSAAQILPQNVSPENFDGPPPVFIGALLDQPKQRTWSDNLTYEDIPLVIGSVVLWGKRTDREAMLEISSILECDLEDVTAQITDSLGDCLSGEPEKVVMDSPSVTIDSFTRQQAFPEDTPAEKIRELQSAHFNDLLINCWTDLPLGVLGSSLKEAAENKEQEPLVRAVIQVVEYLLGAENEQLDFNALKASLNLAPLPVLTVAASDLTALPASLYHCLDMKSLSDADLAMLYARYNPYGTGEAMKKLAQEIVSRDSLSVDIRKTAYIKLCLSPGGIVAENIPQGKDFCKQNGISDSYFDLMELQWQFIHGKFENTEKLMHQIYIDHKDEQNTMQMLMNFVQQIQQMSSMMNQGRPDAVSAGMGAMPGAPADAANSAPSGLWTPDAPNPPAAAPAEKKSSIWLPD